MFTWRKEDPSTKKILEGGTTFRRVYMEKFRSVRLPRREAAGIKDDGRQKQKCNLDPSALFTDLKNYLSAEYLSTSWWHQTKCSAFTGRDYPLNDPLLFLSGLFLVLGSSSRKQFTSNTEKTYGARMFRLRGLSSLHVNSSFPNPLSPKSDEHQISPGKITAL